jgi:hypothetical protein
MFCRFIKGASYRTAKSANQVVSCLLKKSQQLIRNELEGELIKKYWWAVSKNPEPSHLASYRHGELQNVVVHSTGNKNIASKKTRPLFFIPQG